MGMKRCQTCGSPLGFELDGKALKSLVGLDSLGDDDGMQTFLTRLPDERWEEAANVLMGKKVNSLDDDIPF